MRKEKAIKTEKEKNEILEQKVTKARDILGKALSTPENCLSVMRHLQMPGIDFPNPILIATEKALVEFIDNPKYKDKIQHYLAEAEELRERIKEYSKRQKPHFNGEYVWRITQSKESEQRQSKAYKGKKPS